MINFRARNVIDKHILAFIYNMRNSHWKRNLIEESKCAKNTFVVIYTVSLKGYNVSNQSHASCGRKRGNLQK